MRRTLGAGVGLAMLVAGGLALTFVLGGHSAAVSLRAQLNRQLAAAVTGLVHRVTPNASGRVAGPNAAGPAPRAAHRELPRSITGWSCPVAAGSPCRRPSCTVYIAAGSCAHTSEPPLNRILTLRGHPGVAARLHRLGGNGALLAPRQIPSLGGLFSQIHVLSGTP